MHTSKKDSKTVYILFISHGFILVRSILRDLDTMQIYCTAEEFEKKSPGGWLCITYLNLSAWHEQSQQTSYELSRLH